MDTKRLTSLFNDNPDAGVGIFGGSFNPAHSGHAHVADLAAENLGLDKVIWLVSPQNPLKDSDDMAGFDSRFNGAGEIAAQCRHAQKMAVSAMEKTLGTSQTALTLEKIRASLPKARLVWIMGADGLADFHRWHRPELIAQSMAVAVVNRPGFGDKALASRGAEILGRRIDPAGLAQNMLPNHWCFIPGPLNEASATEIRQNRTGPTGNR